jgi:hypothetical protein
MKEETPKGSSFFSPGYIPDRFCKNKTYPTVEYVQAYNGSDDGFEFFGGSVDVKHMVVTNWAQ